MPHPIGESLRAAMRRWASGVTVVTATAGERRAGMTVSAFVSVSLEPPVLLVSLREGSETLDLARASGAFAVSILGETNEALSGRFASPLPAGMTDRFEGVPTVTAETGAPVLADATGWIDCRVRETHAVGTHALLLGDVVAAHASEGPARPLLYVDRGYRRLAP
jgi:flavin reductase (DIM6/NTAB) family NADH-FMN oxidoreductase RutF